MDRSTASTSSRGWWPFGLLCLLSASRWIAIDALPQLSSTLRTEAAGCALAGVLAALLALVRRDVGMRHAEGLTLAAIGGGLLAVPAFGAALRGPAGESFNRTVALCFVPVIVLVWNGVRADADARMTIWPGLAGLGAALLLFPLVRPVSWQGYAGLLLPPLAVGAAIVFAHTVDWSGWGPVFFFAGGGVCLALFEWARTISSKDVTHTTHWQGMLIDCAMAWLVMLSVRGLDSLRYASRYFLIPLMTILEGVILLHEKGDARLWTGIVVMLCAAVTLWWQQAPERDGLHLT